MYEYVVRNNGGKTGGLQNTPMREWSEPLSVRLQDRITNQYSTVLMVASGSGIDLDLRLTSTGH